MYAFLHILMQYFVILFLNSSYDLRRLYQT